MADEEYEDLLVHLGRVLHGHDWAMALAAIEMAASFIISNSDDPEETMAEYFGAIRRNIGLTLE